MRFLATLRRTTFYISLSRGLAVGTLLNVALLASMNSSKLCFRRKSSIPRMQIFQGQANRSSQQKLERVKRNKNNHSLQQPLPPPCNSCKCGSSRPSPGNSRSAGIITMDTPIYGWRGFVDYSWGKAHTQEYSYHLLTSD